MRALTILFFPLLAAGAQSALAAVYSGVVNSDGWRVDASPFECRMVSPIPFYGNAVFESTAGVATTEFRIDTKPGRIAPGQMVMAALAPVWQPGIGTADLGQVPVEDGSNPIQLDVSATETLLSQLYAGREIVIRREQDAGVLLPITTVGFRSAYKDYLGCVAHMLPANFDQIKRTAIYFEMGEFEELPDGEIDKLNQILLYAQADPYLAELYIDGHTDSLGTREENLKISEVRARLVTDYLVKRGLPEDRVVIRWHGERYPVGNNDITDGRAKNRRVTIRLERVEPVKIPSLTASAQ